jgi:hypothetical protein
VRFVDDWVILAPTRWKLRHAICAVNQTLEELWVEQHPDKTFIGRIERGFDFLGYSFSPQGLGVAPQTVHRFLQRVIRLYEQGATNRRLGDMLFGGGGGWVRGYRVWGSPGPIRCKWDEKMPRPSLKGTRRINRIQVSKGC